jgi:hypothetical protein
MPLYWSTDKIIAGKYRLKKPIEVEMDGEDECWSIHMFGYNTELYANGCYNDDNFIKFLEKVINKDYPKNIHGDPYWVKEYDDFREKLMEYLEEEEV